MEIQSSPKAVWARGQGKFSKFYPLLNEFRLVGYSSGNFGKSLLLTSADVTLLFLLTDRLGIAPSTVGALMLVVLVGDLFLDLVVGAVVTWARSKGVSYRVFVAAGAAPCGAGLRTALCAAMAWGRAILGLSDSACSLSRRLFDNRRSAQRPACGNNVRQPRPRASVGLSLFL